MTETEMHINFSSSSIPLVIKEDNKTIFFINFHVMDIKPLHFELVGIFRKPFTINKNELIKTADLG